MIVGQVQTLESHSPKRSHPQSEFNPNRFSFAGGNGSSGHSRAAAARTTSDAFLEAARYDDIDDLMSIASQGVSLNSKDSEGRTALDMASANWHINIVDYLIRNGVDINACNVEKNTPLHWACLNGHIEVVKHLILAGADISFLNNHERTPMDEAVGRGKMDVMDAMNEAAAQVELTGTRVS